MPLSVVRRFPCGEFFPGEAPRPGDGASTNVPPVYIPSNNEFESPVLPVGTLDPPGRGPSTGGPGPGEGDGKGGGMGGGPGGPQEDPENPVTGGGVGPPGGPVDRGPVTGGLNPPKSRCIVVELPCPPGTRGPTKKLRNRVSCTDRDLNNDLPEYNRRRRSGQRFSDNGPWNDNAQGLCLVDQGTLFAGCQSDVFLEPRCVDAGPITGGKPALASTGDSVQIQPNDRPSVITPPRVDSTILLNQENSLAGQVIQSNSVAQQSLIPIPIKVESSFNINSPSLLMRASASSSYNETYGLFDEKFNFFKSTPFDRTTIIRNNSYLNIFKSEVTEEVSYFIRRTYNTLPWNERFFDSLTDDKIIISIREDLLTVISNIHSVGGTRVNRSYFLEAIRSHLVAGTLDEFDPNYYYYIYNSQINDTILNVPSNGETHINLQASIGLFELSSTNPNHTEYSNARIRDDFRRSRFLLEDIEANIPSMKLDGTEYNLYLNNAGVSSELISSTVSSQFLNIGDGAGYYISGMQVSGPEVPLLLTHELSSSRYIAPSLRHNILQLLGTDIGLIITASSVLNQHEFSLSYNASADVSPMYFKLNFETITDITNPNSVVNILSASYSKISDDEAASHSRNYSYNIIKVNLDFRDPIIHYMRDTSTLNLEQDDFNFRAFDTNRSIISNRIILRNLPAAIIVTPGMGTAHNPFNSKSTLLDYEGSSVTRVINLDPSFDANTNLITKPPLPISNTYNTLGTPYHGLYEKLFDQDFHGNIYTYSPSSEVFNKSYFVNGQYTNQQPDSSYRETSPEANLIALVDKLSNLPDVSSLTWWDVYRRLTSTDIGKLSYTKPVNLIRKLASGWRNEVPIKNVLTRVNLKPSGIPEGTTIPDDLIIINESDRELN